MEPRMRLVLHATLVVLACVLGATAHAAPAVWLYHGDAQGSGRRGTTSVDAIGGVRFTTRLDAPVRSTPAVADGRLYVGGTDGVMRALDARNGERKWRYATGGAITSSAAIVADRIFFVSRDGHAYCLRASDGRLVWKRRFGADLGAQNYWDYTLASPVVVGTTLFVGSGDGRLYALDAANGRSRWAYDAHARIRTTVAVHAGRVVFGTTGGHVVALRQRDGALLWSFATMGATHTFADAGNDTTSIVASPTIAEGIVAIGSRDGFLYGLDAQTGAQRWRITHDGSSWILATAYDGHSLYVASGSAQFVQAIDPASGEERWRFATRAAVFSSLTLAGTTLLFADFAGQVYAVDTSTGSQRWAFPLHGRALSTPVVADGVVYCAGDDGVVVALDVAPSGEPTISAARRIAYWQGPSSPDAFGWFQNGVDAAFLAYLVAAGYERMDRDQLVAFLGEATAARTASVVVLVDNRLPEEVADDHAGVAPIRAYLQAGGKVVMLGPNPLAYVTDATGQVVGVDYARPQRIFGVRYEEPANVAGYYASFPTVQGRAMGLRSASIATGAIDAAQASITPLAHDEFGKASAWLKSYGGRRGTGLLQLTLPRQEVSDFAELRAAVERGVAW
jgi:eukaryotic-like serine/threonine-protein kinase